MRLFWGGKKFGYISSANPRRILLGNGGFDLLVGGYTSWDAHRGALLALSAEWNSDRSYIDRRANLLGDEGDSARIAARQNQSFFLNPPATDTRPRTVFNDEQIDLLDGGDGRDWYFASLRAPDPDDDDRINRLVDNELVELW